jgi:cytochrome c2
LAGIFFLTRGDQVLASKIKVMAIAFGLVSSLLLLSLAWQRTSAQSPNEESQPEQEPPHLVTIPTTGYKPAAKSADSEEGRKFFEALNCAGCHSTHNVGGDLGPMLDGVCARRSDRFLIAHLSRAQEAQDDYKRMRGADQYTPLPHARFTPKTASLLVAYLHTLPEPPGGFVVMPHTVRLPAEPKPIVDKNFKPVPKTARAMEGEIAYNKFGCVACHSIGEFGGWLGPRLDGVGARHNRAYIVAHVTDAQAHAKELSPQEEQVKSEMPRFNLSQDEIQKITDYLMTLPFLGEGTR